VGATVEAVVTVGAAVTTLAPALRSPPPPALLALLVLRCCFPHDLFTQCVDGPTVNDLVVSSKRPDGAGIGHRRGAVSDEGGNTLSSEVVSGH
jgi:hypothetical protein